MLYPTRLTVAALTEENKKKGSNHAEENIQTSRIKLGGLMRLRRFVNRREERSGCEMSRNVCVNA